mgnify:CR=1 FL=1
MHHREVVLVAAGARGAAPRAPGAGAPLESHCSVREAQELALTGDCSAASLLAATAGSLEPAELLLLDGVHDVVSVLALGANDNARATSVRNYFDGAGAPPPSSVPAKPVSASRSALPRLPWWGGALASAA